MKKKELILFMPSMDGGGVEKNLILIANFFIKKKINLYLITYENKFKNKLSKKIKVIEPGNIKKDRSKYYKYLVCLLLLVKILLKKNCLVFAFQANIYAIIICKFLKKNIIVRSNSSPSGWNKNLFKNLIFKFFLKRSDEIIVNSKYFKRELDKKFQTQSKLILNPLDKFQILRMSKKKIKFNFFDKKNFNIINIARFTDQKDHLTLLKAFKIVSEKINVKLLLIGYGPYRQKIYDFLYQNKLNKIVKVMNFKINPYPYLKKCNLFILSSKYEGLPNVLLEAQVLKKYIISSDCPTGPKEILNNGNFGSLFKISNHNQLSDQIIDYYKNQIKYKKKIINAYKNLNKYDYEKNCNKYFLTVNKYL
jgi:glycosyltransferase involved in cell wall biosynthesis